MKYSFSFSTVGDGPASFQADDSARIIKYPRVQIRHVHDHGHMYGGGAVASSRAPLSRPFRYQGHVCAQEYAVVYATTLAHFVAWMALLV